MPLGTTAIQGVGAGKLLNSKNKDHSTADTPHNGGPHSCWSYVPVLGPLVDVKVGQRDGGLPEKLVHAEEVAVQHLKSDLCRIALTRNRPDDTNTKLDQLSKGLHSVH